MMIPRFFAVCLTLLSLNPSGSALPAQADRIVIVKSAHTMTLYYGNAALHQYKVALGHGPKGAKER
jgi:hypothetical protein